LCFDFLYKFVCNIFHCRKNRARNDQKCTLVLMHITRYYRQILMKLDF
jgi:hypothetical protein